MPPSTSQSPLSNVPVTDARLADRPGAEAPLAGPARTNPPVIDPPVIDPRGARFGAWVSTVVLAAVVLSRSAWLLAAQALVFALGAAGHPPYAPLWRRLRRLLSIGAPAELEDARPPRFAQGVGLAFALAGLLGTGLLGRGTVVLPVAAAAAFAAALLNAAFGVCLGCTLYLRTVRIRSTGHAIWHNVWQFVQQTRSHA